VGSKSLSARTPTDERGHARRLPRALCRADGACNAPLGHAPQTRLRDRRVAGSQDLQARFLSCGLTTRRVRKRKGPTSRYLERTRSWGTDTRKVALSRKARSAQVLSPAKSRGSLSLGQHQAPSGEALWQPRFARGATAVSVVGSAFASHAKRVAGRRVNVGGGPSPRAGARRACCSGCLPAVSYARFHASRPRGRRPIALHATF
jgi:hypothetical protein